LSEMLGLIRAKQSSTVSRAATLGLMMPMLDASSDIGSARNFGWHFDRLSRAIDLGQAEVFFDGFGRLCAFALWTHPTPAATKVLMAEGSRALGADGLGEAGAPWLLEMQANHGSLPAVMQMLRDRHLSDQHQLTYSRVIRGRRMVKQIARDDRTRFARGTNRFQSIIRGSFLRTSEGQEMLKQSANLVDQAIERGHCLSLLRLKQYFAVRQLSSALQRLEMPFSLRQHRLHMSRQGDALALLTWAWLDRKHLAQWDGCRPENLARYQWNDGDILCVSDAAASPPGRARLRRELAGEWMPDTTLHFMPGWHPDAGVQVSSVTRLSSDQRGFFAEFDLADPHALAPASLTVEASCT